MLTLEALRERCVNGCVAPVQAPSKVLCADCFKKLDMKFRALLRRELGGA